MASRDDLDHSPTTSIFRVLLTLAIALLISLLVDARGIVHAGAGMPDGPRRLMTLAVGQVVLRFADRASLTWPWDQVETALGRTPQPAVPPLLASGADPPPRKSATSWLAPLLSSLHLTKALRPLPTARRRRLHHRAVGAQPALWSARAPDGRHPLRLLVTGDSLTGYLGPALVDAASRVGPIHGFVETHNGTGLTRPDFVDWSLVAREQVAADHPDATVVLMGGNDFQNMTLPGGRFFLAGTPSWMQEYQRRAAICMRIWAQGGHRRVYWLSIPPARDPNWAHDDALINIALRHAAAQAPGAEYLDILGPVTDHGRYADFVTEHGQPVLVREPDGVHLSIEGSAIVAQEVLAVLEREWQLDSRPRRSK